MKIMFFTNISHDFRTPLSLILAPLDKIIKNANDSDQQKQLTLVQRNARRLLNLVNLLLDFRKMEVQEFKINATEGDLIYFLKDLTQKTYCSEFSIKLLGLLHLFRQRQDGKDCV